MFDCHVSNFKIRPNGDSAHVQLIVTFQTMDLLYNNFILYALVNDMHVTYIRANSCITDHLWWRRNSQSLKWQFCIMTWQITQKTSWYWITVKFQISKDIQYLLCPCLHHGFGNT